jgi:hypothetical protein
MPQRLVLLLAGIAAALPAQTIKLGAKAGVPLTPYFETGQAMVRGGTVAFSSETRRYTLGPSVEWRITPQFGFELDALYKRPNYVRTENTTVSGVTIDSSIEVTGRSWDFPILAKYLWDSRVPTFVSAGFAVRYMGSARSRGVETVQTAQTTTTRSIDSEESLPVFVPGAAVAVGVELGRTRLRVLPELRYTRWRNTRISEPLRLEQNQVELLLGFLF